MNIKFLLPLILLASVGLLRQTYDGWNATAVDANHSANQITLSDILSADNGVIDLMPTKDVVVNDPEDLRKPGLYGYTSYKPGMAGEGDTILILDQVITGHPGRRTKPQRPADYRMLRFDQTCARRPPKSGESIVNANIGRTLNPSDLHAFSEAEMAEESRHWLAAHFSRPRSVSEKTIVRDHDVPVVDIAITDTSGPIYLILQHQQGSALWNIHTAPGVTIAHIVTVGPDTVALNPPPGDYDIQMLRAGTDCIPSVARQPQPWWGIFRKMDHLKWDDEKQELQAEIDALFASHNVYDKWFRAAFGQPSEQGIVGFELTDYLLAGPIPETPEARIPYRPIQGSTVRVSQADYIFTSPKKDRVAFMMELQRDFIATAAGGTIDALYPEPMQRAVQ